MMKKSLTTDADTVVFDLEDPVPRADKADARRNVAEFVPDIDTDVEVGVRVNPVGSEFWDADVQSLPAEDVDLIKLPLVETTDDLTRAIDALTGLTDDPPELAVALETPRGVFNGAEISERATAEDLVTAIIPGVADYTRVIGATGTPESTRAFVNQFILGYASIASAQPLASVYPKLTDLEGLRRRASEMYELGFHGMTVIHPDQIEVVNDVFTPSEATYERALEYVRAFDRSDADAIRVDGTLLDNAFVDQYRELIHRYDTIKGIDSGIARSDR